MRKVILPDWFKKLPEESFIKATQVKLLYGYAEKTCSTMLISRGYIPKESKRETILGTVTCFWKVSYLREVIENTEDCPVKNVRKKSVSTKERKKHVNKKAKQNYHSRQRSPFEVMKPRAVSRKESNRQRDIVKYGIDLVETMEGQRDRYELSDFM